MLSIARAELRQILRNKTVLAAGTLIPLAVSLILVYKHETFEDFGSLGYIAATVVFTMSAFGLYTTVVTTLASRRQNLLLKRLRSTSSSDRSILIGLVLPSLLLALAQIVGTLVVLAVVAGGPDELTMLIAGVAATLLMMLCLGLGTAGVTNSPEHAQVTTLPISLGVIGVSIWVGITGTDDLALLKRLLPGGSATELITNAWNGGTSVSDSFLLLAPTTAWVIVAAALAFRFFRWQPRR